MKIFYQQKQYCIETDNETGTIVGVIDEISEITSLVVWNPNDRKKGIGKELLMGFLDECKKNNSKECIVTSTKTSKKFYKKYGFVGNKLILKLILD